MTWHF